MLAGLQRGEKDSVRGVHLIGPPGDACECGLDPFEITDRPAELRAYPGIGPGIAGRQFAAACRERRQGDTATLRERLHEHPPALADPVSAADDPIDRDEDTAPDQGSVLEGDAERQVAAPALDAGRVAWDQGEGEAGLRIVAEQPVRVGQAEGQSDQRRDRSQGDVAFVEIDPDPERGAALEDAAAHDPDVRRRGRVAAGLWAGQCEAGDLIAAGQAREPAVTLGLGAVAQQQLGRPQAVGHHHGHRGGDAAAGELHDDLGVGQRGEAESAVAGRDDESEETLAPDEGPDLGRQVHVLVGDAPVVEHPTELLDRAVQKRLLGGAQAGRRQVAQARPLGTARKKLGIPPGAADLQRLLLGAGHGRHDAPELFQQVSGDQGPAERGDEGDRSECRGKGAERDKRDGHVRSPPSRWPSWTEPFRSPVWSVRGLFSR